MDGAPRRSRSEISALETAILASLRENPRATNKSLAGKLGVGEATIANRIRSLEDRGVMQVIAKRDLRAAGYDVLAQVDIDVRGRKPSDVGAEFALMDQVSAVGIMSGHPSLLLTVHAENLASLRTFIVDVAANVEGVAQIGTSLLVEIMKFNADHSRNLKDDR